MAKEGVQEKPQDSPGKGDTVEPVKFELSDGSSTSQPDLGKEVFTPPADQKSQDVAFSETKAQPGSNTADRHLTEVDIVDANGGDQDEDKLDIATILKTDFLGGDSKRYEWLPKNATEKQIEAGIQQRIAASDPAWQARSEKAKDLDLDKLKNGDIVTYEKDGQVQLAVVRIVNGKVGFHAHTNKSGSGEPITRSTDLKQAFTGLDDNATIKIYGESAAAGSQDRATVADRPQETARVDVVAARAPEDLRSLIAERNELLTSGKRPDEQIEVKKGDQVVSMPVSERLKEIETRMLGNDKVEGGSPRLEIVDPVEAMIKEGSDKLRVSDLVVKTSVDELNKLQEEGKKPTDKVTVTRIVDGKSVEQEVTVEERVKELKTTIRDELNRSFATADKVSPGPIDMAATRELDIKMAESVAERTRLARKLGIFDQSQLTVENIDKMTPANDQERQDLAALKDTIVKTDQIQDVRHGLAYTRLRSAEMKALGYANPDVPLGMTGTPEDVISANVDLTHAKQVDRELRASQAGYDVEIIVSNKILPMLANAETTVKFVKAEDEANRTGMPIEQTIEHAMEQEDKAKQIEALLTLGDKGASESDKRLAIEILVESNKANAAGQKLDIKTEGDALRLAAEKAKELDIAFLNSEAMKDYYRMRDIQGNVVNPDDPNRRVPTFSEQFQAIANIGAKAKLDYALYLRDNGQNNYTALAEMGDRYKGKDLSQALEAAKGTKDQEVLEKIARDYVGEDSSKYQGVRVDTLLDQARNTVDDASLLFMQVKAEAPHMIFQRNGDQLEYINEDLRNFDYQASIGVSSVDPAEWVKAKQRYDRVVTGESDVDENGRKIDPQAEIDKMYQVTRLVELDVERQNKKLQARVDELKKEEQGLGQKQFATEEARTLERQRIDREIKYLESTILERESSVKHQKNLTRFLDASNSFGQENFDHAKKMLDLIKAEDPELYNNKELNMEDLHGRSSSWWRRNWRTVAAVVTVAAAVAIGVSTLGAGTGLSAGMLLGAKALLAGGVGAATYMGMEKYATGDLDANFIDRFASGKTNWRTGAEGFAMGFSSAGTVGATRMLFASNSMRAAAIASGEIAAPTGIRATSLYYASQAGKFTAASVAPLAPYAGIGAYDVSQGNQTWGGLGQELAMRGLLNSVYVGTMGLAPSSGILGNAMAPNAFRIGQGGSLAMNTLKGVAGREYAAVFGDGIKFGLDRLQGDQHAPSYDFWQNNEGAYRDGDLGNLGYGAFRSLAARSYSHFNGSGLDVHDSRDYSRFLNNLSDSGAIFGLRSATADNMLFRGQNLPFQIRPVQPTVRKLFIPEFSDQPMLQVQVGGRSMIIPADPGSYDSSKPRPSRLEFRVDELVPKNAFDARNLRGR